MLNVSGWLTLAVADVVGVKAARLMLHNDRQRCCLLSDLIQQQLKLCVYICLLSSKQQLTSDNPKASYFC